MTLEDIRDRLDGRPREKHAGLRCIDTDVRERRLELRAYDFRWRLVHGCHTEGVLRRERDDRALPVAARASERLQVRLDAGAPA